MTRRIESLLPWIAVLSALAVVILTLIGISQRLQMVTDNGTTRPVASAAVERIIAQPPTSLDDIDFRRSLEALPGNAYISSVWLFDPDGQIISSTGMMVPREGTAAEHATAETRRLLETLPQDALTDEQRTLLLAASAIQSEGEHNDVLRHFVREVRSSDGVLLGWIGVAYDVNLAMGAPGTGWIISLFAWLFFLGIYWLSLPLWVWLDARRRGERAGVWAMFVLVGNLVALMAYVLTRPNSA